MYVHSGGGKQVLFSKFSQRKIGEMTGEIIIIKTTKKGIGVLKKYCQRIIINE